MIPPVTQRFGRLLSHDTSFARLVTAMGLVLLGASMSLGLGSGKPGYILLEDAWPLPFWGVIYLSAGCWGVYGSVSRIPYWVRIGHTMICMWLWAFMALAQFSDQPLPTRMLLILPALVDIWVLAKVVIAGSRKDAK